MGKAEARDDRDSQPGLATAVVVIGASAGGVEALMALVSGLPPGFPAAVCVVLHMPPNVRSRLPELLARAGPLPTVQAATGMPLAPGTIFVAPPDRHLLVRIGYVEANRGPRENRSRPAVDPLFRSAARAYGPRAIAVVLSGALDDGATGLLSVAARGGTIVVQDPAEAPFSGMPTAALRTIRPDHILPAAAIGPRLADLVRTLPAGEGEATMGATEDAQTIPERRDGVPTPDTPGNDLVNRDLSAQATDGRTDALTVYTCPECGGSMWQVGAGEGAQFRCHTGHVYAPLALLAQQSDDLEAALWRCVRMLTEKATLTRQLAAQERGRGNAAAAARIEEQVALDDRHIAVLRDQLLGALASPVTQTFAVLESLADAES